MTKIAGLILAAGRGTRMKSNLPKVLHSIAGKPILHWILDLTTTLQLTKTVVVYGYGKELLAESCGNRDIDWVLQEQQCGTGHAALQAISKLKNTDKVVVLCGDVPLISTATLEELIAKTKSDEVGIVTAIVGNPQGLGRIIRNKKDNITGIVEEKDADANTKIVNEINAGIYLFPSRFLIDSLQKLESNNLQQEYYLTDLIARAVSENIKVINVLATNEHEVQGVNDKLQLEHLERHVQQQQALELMQQGVTIMDAKRIDLRTTELHIGSDVTIDINVILVGNVTIKDNTYIGPNTIITNSTIGSNVRIEANSVVEGATIGNSCTIGPFARVRPGTVLESKARVGNFVEIKKSTVGAKSKINHLSYIGDCEIGNSVNIGAGTITCNYDGIKKHQTIIEDNVFIGSDTQLVAPVKIGKGATIAAGTTLIKDAPAAKLTLNKKSQTIVDNWQRPVKD